MHHTCVYICTSYSRLLIDVAYLLCCCGEASEEEEVIDDVIDDVMEWGLTADDAGDGVDDVAPEHQQDGV
jgi:hypothetical protein